MNKHVIASWYMRYRNAIETQFHVRCLQLISVKIQVWKKLINHEESWKRRLVQLKTIKLHFLLFDSYLILLFYIVRTPCVTANIRQIENWPYCWFCSGGSCTTKLFWPGVKILRGLKNENWVRKHSRNLSTNALKKKMKK